MSFIEDNIALVDPFGDGIQTNDEYEEEATLFNTQAKAWSVYDGWKESIASYLNRRPCAEAQPCW